jgi:hypothetical protein
MDFVDAGRAFLLVHLARFPTSLIGQVQVFAMIIGI